MRQPAATRKFLTTSEAAAMLKISVATLKRWAQAGLVASERTEGGHRRFSRAALEVLAAPPPAGPTPASAKADELLRTGTVAEAAALALRGRREGGSWAAFGDGLRPAVIELHHRRQAGTITAVQWLAACDRLRSALAVLADPLQGGDAPRPSLLVATAPGDRLQHGALLAELVAAEAGWAGRHAGAATAHELAAELARERAGGVLVNASADADPGSLARLGRELAELGARTGTPVALAGLGAWPDNAPGLVRLEALVELRAWLDGLRLPHPAPGPLVEPDDAEPPEWDSSLELGEVTIDAQHKVLFGTVRRLGQAVREGAGREELDQLFDFALDYVAVHFRCEENLMRSRGYPYLDAHAWEHEQFARQVTEAAAERAQPGALARLANLIQTWLLQHLMGSDRKLGTWLHQQQATG